MQPENTGIAQDSDLYPPQLAAAEGNEPGPTTLRKPEDVATGLGSMVIRLRHLQLARFSGVYLWALIIVIFSITLPGTFLTSTTWGSIAATQAITAIVAVGLLGALAAGSFDLSVGSNLGLSAIVCSWLTVHHHVNPVIGVLVTIAVGLAIGAVNATLIVVVSIDSFIVTLGVSSILLAATELISQDQFIGPLPTSLQNFANWQFLGLTGVVWYAIGIAIVVWTVLEHTAMGRRTAATGANLEAARLAGVAANRHRVVTLIVSATLASLAGALVAARTGEVSSTIGAPYLLPAFSACFLGTTQLKPGRFNVWGTILALLLLGTGVAGLQLLGGQLWISDMFTGAALVLAVALAALGQRQRLRRLKQQTEAEAA